MAKPKGRSVKGAKGKPSALAQAEQNDRMLRRSLFLQRRIKASASALVRACVAADRATLEAAVTIANGQHMRVIPREDFERLHEENSKLRTRTDALASHLERVLTPGMPEEG